MKHLPGRRVALRALLGVPPVFGASSAYAQAGTQHFYPDVVPGEPLRFPADHGAHPRFRTEWWYLTGWLRRLDGAQRGKPVGVQVTFFRTRTQHDSADPSRFAPLQLLFAHVALALPERGNLLAAQRAAREGFGLARAASDDTDVAIGDWSLLRENDDVYRTRISDPSLAIALSFTAHGSPVLQGDEGFSRKGPLRSQASYYYSRPQLAVDGTMRTGSSPVRVDGLAWLDHEWSSQILDPHAEGWDWVGLNFDDGSAWMAFRIRRRDGATLWSDATAVSTRGNHKSPARFEPLREWTSPRTGTRYPVSMQLTLDDRVVVLEPLFDDQELDTRATTGVVYWEGAVHVLEGGHVVGRGYLELTGYHGPVRL